MEKLNRAQKCSILGPQNLGSRGRKHYDAGFVHFFFSLLISSEVIPIADRNACVGSMEEDPAA